MGRQMTDVMWPRAQVRLSIIETNTSCREVYGTDIVRLSSADLTQL